MTAMDRLGFLFHTPELLNHFRDVIDLLPPGSFDLVVCWDAENSPDMRAAAQRWNANLVTTAEVLQSGRRYRFLVSNHPVQVGPQPLIKDLAEKNVRFMYAAGKSGWNLSDWNRLYDLILCFGPFHAAAFGECSDAVVLQMGYPRFDRFFDPSVDFTELRRRFNCDPGRKTVVWLPTWSTLSSIGLFDQEVAALMETHNVVVKVHPLMPKSEPERVAALKTRGFTCFIEDATDNLPLYQLADCMLFDYGGPPFAGIYTDKDMLLLNVPDAQSDPLMGDDSPDILIRHHLPNVDAHEDGIAQALNDPDLWPAQKATRRFLRREFFAPYYGFSSSVAASALMNLRNILPSGTQR
jgi:hypothetical protein